MSSDEFIKISEAIIKVSKNIPNLGEILIYIDEVRKYHSRLQKKLEYLISDPISYETQEERDLILAIAKEIKLLCIDYNIKYTFYKLPKEWSKFRDEFKSTLIFANYEYNNISITDLIVSIKRKKIKKDKEVKNKIELSELNFEEDMSSKSFITENNDLPGGY